MTYKESIEYLYGLGNEVSAMKLGLENISKLLAVLGNPERKYKKVQVAGTNGKGSTCAFLEAICISARIKVGLSTSPHLISITERIKIGGEEISDKDFARHATIIKKSSEKLVCENKLETVPTFFEQITAIALNAFADAKIELAVLETGLGGRFDATTAARAEIVGITPIDYDHEKILGNTLTEIAAEKAAIIRADTKVVLSAQSKEAERVLLDACAESGVTPILTSAVETEKSAALNENAAVNFKTPRGEYKNINLSLRGRHQIENAKTAILLAEILQGNFKISNENICEGLQNAVHKGRLELHKNILFDGAHNVAGARALRNYLDECANQKIILIFGAMRDKNLCEIGAMVFPKAEKIIFTKSENSRSFETDELIEFLPKDFKRENVFQAESIAEALKKAEEISTKNDLICVTGSLYLVGEAQREIKALKDL